MDMFLTEAHKIFRDQIRRFCEFEIAPLVEEAEETETFPLHLFPEMGKLGYLAIRYPEKYGSADADKLTDVLLREQMSRVCQGIAIAKALIIDSEEYNIPYRTVPNNLTDSEVSRCNTAFHDAVNELLELEDDNYKIGRDEIKNIFAVHRKYLQDKNLLNDIFLGKPVASMYLDSFAGHFISGLSGKPFPGHGMKHGGRLAAVGVIKVHLPRQ